jgi:hypothetical protein
MRKVMSGLAWPRRLLIVTISTPASINCEAWVCRANQFERKGLHVSGAGSPTVNNLNIAVDGPTKRLNGVFEYRDPGVSFLIVRGRHERADASHPLRLLCAGAARPASG